MRRVGLAAPAWALVAVVLLALAGCRSRPVPGSPEADAALRANNGSGTPPVGATTYGDLTQPITLTAKNRRDLIPHTEGSSWSYSVELNVAVKGATPQNRKGEVMYKIDASKHEGNADRFQLGLYRDGKKADEQGWRIDDTGIYQSTLTPAARPFEPPQPVVKFGLPDNTNFTWEGTAPGAKGARVKGKLEGKMLANQTVDTDMGPINAFFIESVSLYSGADGPESTITDTYLRPGVGIVRYIQTTISKNRRVKTTLRLKSFTIK